MQANANALYYLENQTRLLPIIDLIINVITQVLKELRFMVLRTLCCLLFFFRNYYKGIMKLEPIVEPIIKRLLSKVKPRNWRYYTDTVWAICTL
jgi:hypothetical protein